jgi:hypothetical protein
MMNLRETLNQKPGLAVGLTAGIIIVAALLIYFQVRTPSIDETPDQVYYTDDNGQTYFADDFNKVVPFDHNGKQAYRAEVFQCGNDKPFVAIIGRHTPGGKDELQKYIDNPPKDSDGLIRMGIDRRGLEVQKVGSNPKVWVFSGDYDAEKLRENIKCPDGSPAKPVLP